MPYYQIRFSRDENHRYSYPDGVARVVWRSAVYHATDTMMIGETDQSVSSDGKKVVALTDEQARESIEKLGAVRGRGEAAKA